MTRPSMALLAFLAVSIPACGEEDLVIPGAPAPTSTPESTATPSPTPTQTPTP